MSSQEANQSLLVGTFTLDSFLIESPDGDQKPWGTNARGLLIYSADGYMSVAINSDITANDAGSASTPSSIEAIFDSILFYSGRYQLEGGNLIRHHVINASNPDRIGKELLRFADWDSGCLKLATPSESFGRALLVWRRI